MGGFEDLDDRGGVRGDAGIDADAEDLGIEVGQLDRRLDGLLQQGMGPWRQCGHIFGQHPVDEADGQGQVDLEGVKIILVVVAGPVQGKAREFPVQTDVFFRCGVIRHGFPPGRQDRCASERNVSSCLRMGCKKSTRHGLRGVGYEAALASTWARMRHTPQISLEDG
jgi:hypothetical protein